ncbi:MAG: hypothetical protein COB04_02205 [Gammaproteobacteria bacterium]|nr:MAG: hypothetical protein COB04_02205 [Gammaproteobacteria bacterium]
MEDNLERREINRESNSLLWIISITSSIIFSFLMAWMWYSVDNEYNPNTSQLVSTNAAESDLIRKLKSSKDFANREFTYIPTGIYIQSLDFKNSSDVNITGYVWQKYKSDQIIESPGFLFPEQVDSGSAIEPRLIYTHPQGENTVYGWYFEATLRQTFNYRDYPLDHKTVWIRIWPSDFNHDAILIPALQDYQSTTPGVSFGLDQELVLGNWNINETFFNFRKVSYDTNFGIKDRNVSRTFPELYFNIVIKRKFLNSFVVHLIPVFTVLVFLYTIVLTSTKSRDKAEIFGFNVMGTVSINSALFFVVMLSHVHIRQKFPSEGIVYIEYFYLVMYGLMIAIIINTFLVTTNQSIFSRMISWQDNLIPKVAYWPFTTGTLSLITYICFF